MFIFFVIRKRIFTLYEIIARLRDNIDDKNGSTDEPYTVDQWIAVH